MHTLEKSGEDKYMIVSTPEIGTHLNHGDFEEEPTLDIFLNNIYSRYEKESNNKFVLFLIFAVVIFLLLYLLFK